MMNAFNPGEFEKHKTEAKEKWGQTAAYGEYESKTKDYSAARWNDLSGEMDQLLASFAACMKSGESPDSTDAQTLVKALQAHISQHYYHCTNEILAGLGRMYVGDDRFRENMDKHASGTAAFISEAIRSYCGK